MSTLLGTLRAPTGGLATATQTMRLPLIFRGGAVRHRPWGHGDRASRRASGARYPPLMRARLIDVVRDPRAEPCLRQSFAEEGKHRYTGGDASKRLRMVLEVMPQYESEYAAMKAVAVKLGIGTAETLRKWVRPTSTLVAVRA